jgi:arsenate reductase
MTEKSDQRKKKILFVCFGNMIRSQMAEGFGREHGGDVLEVFSAGLQPTGVVSEDAIVAMEEKGIDIKQQSSKGLDDVPLGDMDYVVSLLGRPASSFCPQSFAGTTVDWDIDDPVGHSYDYFLATRNDLERRIKKLIEQIRDDDGK